MRLKKTRKKKNEIYKLNFISLNKYKYKTDVK